MNPKRGTSSGAPRKAPGPKSGARIMVEAMEDVGVKHIFGYPGGACLPLLRRRRR